MRQKAKRRLHSLRRSNGDHRAVCSIAVAALLTLTARAPLLAQAAPELNPQYPLQFYEMARRQDKTDAACAATAQRVAAMIAKHGQSSPQFLPAWDLRLGDALRAAGQAREALAAYDRLLALPPGAPVAAAGPHGDLKAYQREALLNQSALLARLGATDESRAKLLSVDPASSRERLLAAETRLLNRDLVTDLLRDIRGDGHPERNWGHVYNPLRAAMLAHTAGESDLATRYAGPLAKRGQGAERWPHWKSAWAQADQLVRFSALGPLKTTGLRNGTYSGASVGFYSPLLVEVRITAGTLAETRVVKHVEDRPRNAFDGFVKRLKGPDPLRVDAVTGATQTCHGLLLAVEDALRKAAPTGQAAPKTR